MQFILVVSAFLAGLFATAYGGPSFPSFNYQVTIKELTEPDTEIISVVAINEETSETRYSISPDRNLGIKANGAVFTKGEIDYETNSKITARVTASNGDGNDETVLLVVTITDENDNSPIFTKKYSATLEADGDEVVTKMTPLIITAIDLDSGANSDITYSITSGNLLGNFKIDSKSGALTLVKPYDTKGITKIKLSIAATDGGTTPQQSVIDVPLTIKKFPTEAPTTPAATTEAPATKAGAEGTFVCTRKWMVQRGDGSDGKCYKLVRGLKNWEDAQNYCRWLGVRSGLIPGNLVTIEDSRKQDWVVNGLMSKRHSIWSGLNDLDTEGTMTWIDGSTYVDGKDFSDWAVLRGVQQPAGGAVKNCVAIEGTLRQRGAFLGKWNDFKCTMKSWSVCEFPSTV